MTGSGEASNGLLVINFAKFNAIYKSGCFVRAHCLPNRLFGKFGLRFHQVCAVMVFCFLKFAIASFQSKGHAFAQ